MFGLPVKVASLPSISKFSSILIKVASVRQNGLRLWPECLVGRERLGAVFQRNLPSICPSARYSRQFNRLES